MNIIFYIGKQHQSSTLSPETSYNRTRNDSGERTDTDWNAETGIMTEDGMTMTETATTDAETTTIGAG